MKIYQAEGLPAVARFKDLRLQDVYETRSCPSLPAELVQEAYRLTRLLIAAADLRDVTTFAPDVVQCGTSTFEVPVFGKWSITFEWDPDLGSHEMDLHR